MVSVPPVLPATIAAKATLPRIVRAGISTAPTLQVWVNFSGTEVNIAADVRRISISRGRSRERETMSPGRAEIDLWNFAGKYDPDNYGSPYYPNIRPNKPVRILAATDTGTVPLFDGRLEGSTMSHDEGGLQPTVVWQAVDASKRLNRDGSTTGFGEAGDRSGVRVNAVLDGATPVWPTSERNVLPGTKTVQYEEGDQGRYDYLVQVAASEPGAFFIGADGKAVYRDATWAPAAAQPALGSATGEQRFSSIEITDDESEIYNAITVTASTLADQVEEDLSSEAEFGRSDLSISSLLDSVSDMDDLALTYLVAYSSPRRRVSRLTVDRAAADWYWYLSKELMDRVSVRHRPVYGGTFQQTSAIQGIQVKVEGSQKWELTWNLSPPLDIISNPNLLTENQSSMETDASGWEVYFTGSPPGNGIYISGVAGGTTALVGAQCLEVHCFGTPQIQGGVRTKPYTTVPVTVGHTYRGSAWVRNYYGTYYAFCTIEWRNSGGGTVSEVQGAIGGGYFAPDPSEWKQVTVEAIAPAGAVYATLGVRIIDLEYDQHWNGIDAAELRDTLVIGPTQPQPAKISATAALPAPTILTTPQNRTVAVPTIARAVVIPTPTIPMPQTARPTSAINEVSGSGGWGGSSAPDAINDQSDATYMTGTLSGNTTGEYGHLTSLTDPVKSTGHVFWCRAQMNGSGTGVNQCLLYQGDPFSGGTLLATINIATTVGVTTDLSTTLSGAVADSITDYTDLWWNLHKSGGSSQVQVYEVWFAIT